MRLLPLLFFAVILTVNNATVLLFSSATEPSGSYCLDFTGGVVEMPTMLPIPTRATVQVPSFRPLGPPESGDRIAKLVVEKVREDFARWPGIDIRAGESHECGGNAVIVGGIASGSLLGLAQTIDVGDRSSNDKALVFSEGVLYSLTRGLRFVPTEEEQARAVANVVSHEIGHLLGFAHIPDPFDIMAPTVDVAAGGDQAFLHYHQAYVDRRVLVWMSTR